MCVDRVVKNSRMSEWSQEVWCWWGYIDKNGLEVWSMSLSYSYYLAVDSFFLSLASIGTGTVLNFSSSSYDTSVLCNSSRREICFVGRLRHRELQYSSSELTWEVADGRGGFKFNSVSDTANVSDIVIASTRLNGCDLFREGKICVKFETKVTN